MNDAANDCPRGERRPQHQPIRRVRELLRAPRPDHCALDRDLFIVDDRRRTGWLRPSRVGRGARWRRVHEVVCFLHRRRSGGRGSVGAMLEALEERAAAVATDHPTDRPVVLHGRRRSANPGADALLTVGCGYVPIRLPLRRWSAEPRPGARRAAAGRPRDPAGRGRSTSAPIFDAAVEAARGLWGYTRTDRGRYFDWFLTEPIESSDRIALADRLGRRPGRRTGPRRSSTHDENERFGEKRGWVETSVVRAAVAAARSGAGAHRVDASTASANAA